MQYLSLFVAIMMATLNLRFALEKVPYPAATKPISRKELWVFLLMSVYFSGCVIVWAMNFSTLGKFSIKLTLVPAAVSLAYTLLWTAWKVHNHVLQLQVRAVRLKRIMEAMLICVISGALLAGAIIFTALF